MNAYIRIFEFNVKPLASRKELDLRHRVAARVRARLAPGRPAAP